MAISRTRLRLALWFAGAVFLIVTLINVAMSAYLYRTEKIRFHDTVQRIAVDLLAAVRREQTVERLPVADAAVDAITEWSSEPGAFAVIDARDSVLARRDRRGVLARSLAAVRASPGRTSWLLAVDRERDLRVVVAKDEMVPPLRAVVARSTADLREYGAVLIRWLFVSIPAVTVLTLIAGYTLARRALRPVEQMASVMSDMAGEDLHTRLPVREPPDEFDVMAEQFNALLARLADARERNRRFLAQAAHQIKTPLTVVRGESTLGLERPREPAAYRDILRRVQRAAERMSRRVDDLFLLAEAESERRPATNEAVELDGVVLECTDLMRGRAQHARRTLELSRVEAVVARGNEHLLREAVTELIENALKHSNGQSPIAVAAFLAGDRAHLEVSSAGTFVNDCRSTTQDSQDSQGLGLSIVRRIADVHNGDLEYRHHDGINVFSIVWPALGSR